MINIEHILFYSSILINTVWDSRRLIPHCTYIKSPTDYKKYQQTENLSKPISKELLWWNETLKGNLFP